MRQQCGDHPASCKSWDWSTRLGMDMDVATPRRRPMPPGARRRRASCVVRCVAAAEAVSQAVEVKVVARVRALHALLRTAWPTASIIKGAAGLAVDASPGHGRISSGNVSLDESRKPRGTRCITASARLATRMARRGARIAASSRIQDIPDRRKRSLACSLRHLPMMRYIMRTVYPCQCSSALLAAATSKACCHHFVTSLTNARGNSQSEQHPCMDDNVASTNTNGKAPGGALCVGGASAGQCKP